MPSKLQYRADIDGLRAVAVLSVLFYHAGSRLFSGGFVGVDVFFVISGYLITSIIINEIKANEFHLVNFYERRIRRIFPVLFAVVDFTLLCGALIYDADNYADLGNSAISVTFFYSNIHFWSQSGYFERASTLKPLLHAWSLSVEEQFYILFPILVVLIRRFFKSRFALSLTLVTIISFALSIYGAQHDATSAFYLTQYRAWELLIGSILGLRVVPVPSNTTLRNSFSLAGIIMILASVVLYSYDTPFPGTAALLPVLGSALVIFSGQDGTSFIGRFLSLQPLVFIGKISYSLYIWHWPLLIFTKYYLILEPTTGQLTVWLLSTFAISILSWKYIESPFRVKTFLKKPRIFAFAGSVMTLSLIASTAIYLYRGFPSRFSSDQTFLGRDDPEWVQWRRCTVARENGPINKIRLCNLGAEDKSPSFLMWGDSHARALAPAVDTSATQAEITGSMTAMTSCPPLIGIDRLDEFTGYCSEYNDLVINYIQNHTEVKTIILTARWALAADGGYYKGEEGTTIKLVDTRQEQNGPNSVLFDLGLHRTISRLLELDRTIVIVSDVPEIGYDVPSAFSIATRTGRDINQIIAPTMKEYQDRNRIVLDILNSFTIDKAVVIVDPTKALCDADRCYVTVDGQPLYLDNNHLSTFGSHYISYLFNPVFETHTLK